VEKVGRSNTGIVQSAIRLRCFRKHKLQDPKGKEEETVGAAEETLNIHSLFDVELGGVERRCHEKKNRMDGEEMLEIEGR
jgi:hypothetical protein